MIPMGYVLNSGCGFRKNPLCNQCALFTAIDAGPVNTQISFPGARSSINTKEKLLPFGRFYLGVAFPLVFPAEAGFAAVLAFSSPVVPGSCAEISTF